jgi:hypothetical protein
MNSRRFLSTPSTQTEVSETFLIDKETDLSEKGRNLNDDTDIPLETKVV